MLSLEEYRKIRQIGAYKQEQADLEQVQGSFLEELGNRGLAHEKGEDYEEDEKKKKKGMPKAEKIAVIKLLKKKAK